MQCKNCLEDFSGSFCPYCGQRARVDRLNFKYFLGELSETIFQLNHGFFRTFIDLFWRPGHLVREYLLGKRKQYYKPIAYAFTMSTIYFFLSRFLEVNTIFEDFVSGWNSGSSDRGRDKLNLDWLSDNYSLLTLALIPVYAFCMRLAFYRKGFNYIEHIAIRSFVVGQQAVVYVFFVLLISLFGKNYTLESTPFYTAFAYVFWTNIQLFRPNPIWNTVLRTIGFYLLFVIISYFLFGILFILFKVLETII